MVIKTIHIILIAYFLEILVLYFCALLTKILRKIFEPYKKHAFYVFAVICSLFILLFSLFGFLEVATLFEKLGFEVNIGGHNAYGAVFFMFFTVIGLGVIVLMHCFELLGERSYPVDRDNKLFP